MFVPWLLDTIRPRSLALVTLSSSLPYTTIGVNWGLSSAKDVLSSMHLSLLSLTLFCVIYHSATLIRDLLGTTSVALIFNDVLVSSTLRLPVNIFTWKKKKPCSRGATKIFVPRARIELTTLRILDRTF